MLSLLANKRHHANSCCVTVGQLSLSVLHCEHVQHKLTHGSQHLKHLHSILKHIHCTVTQWPFSPDITLRVGGVNDRKRKCCLWIVVWREQEVIPFSWRSFSRETSPNSTSSFCLKLSVKHYRECTEEEPGLTFSSGMVMMRVRGTLMSGLLV